MKKLFSCLYGSKLYGTDTPESDRDVKHIVLPPIEDLLLGNAVKNVVKKSNTKRNVQNGPDDIDEEFIPIQVFAKDFLEGQTYALELAFAIDSNHAEQTLYYDGDPVATGDVRGMGRFVRFCSELRTKFLTSDIHAMTRYAVNQANLYSDKGERLNAAVALQAFFQGFQESEKLSAKAKHIALDVVELSQRFPDHIWVGLYDQSGKGNMQPCIKLLGRIIPYTTSFGTAMRTVQSIINHYGDRAKEASSDSVDWKAMMHALRIMDEATVLLIEHRLEFPLPRGYTEDLLYIKRGERTLDSVKAMIQARMNGLHFLESSSNLPKLTQELRDEHKAWLTRWLKEFYL